MITKRPKLLLVEDDAILLEVTETLLRKHFEVVSAASVTEATLQLTAQHFDVLLTDLHLPEDGDGVALANVMRHAQPEAMIVLASGSIVDAKLALQMDAVIMKPYEVEELVQLILHKLCSKPANRGRERGHHA